MVADLPARKEVIQPRIVERIVVAPPAVKVSVFVPPKNNALTDVSTYAPAVPGLLVALFGLWAAHALTRQRDRSKAVAELCENLKKLAGEAAASAIDAWHEEKTDKRALMIASTKRHLQSTGTTATTLKRRTMARKAWGQNASSGWWIFRNLERRYIDVVGDVAFLRRVSMADPFEDPNRPGRRDMADAINSAVSSLQSNIDRLLYDYQG